MRNPVFLYAAWGILAFTTTLLKLCAFTLFITWIYMVWNGISLNGIEFLVMAGILLFPIAMCSKLVLYIKYERMVRR